MRCQFRRLLCAPLVAALSLLPTGVVQAAPLFYNYMDTQFGAVGSPFPGDTYAVTPLQAPGPLTIYQMKVGDTVSITAADGDVFDYNVGLLTNGSADFIASFFRVAGAGAAGGFADSPSLLAGRTIDEFRFTLDALYSQSPGFDLNGDGNWTDYLVLATLEVFGQGDPVSVFPAPPRDLTPHFVCVSTSHFTCPADGTTSEPSPIPEPASIALLGSGLAFLAFRRVTRAN
jgi:hypothetical protein